jgi:hypothetical protein
MFALFTSPVMFALLLGAISREYAGPSNRAGSSRNGMATLIRFAEGLIIGYASAGLAALLHLTPAIGGVLPPKIHYFSAVIAEIVILFGVRSGFWQLIRGLGLFFMISAFTAFFKGGWTNFHDYHEHKLFYDEHALATALGICIAVFVGTTLWIRLKSEKGVASDCRLTLRYRVSVFILTLACTSFMAFKIWTADLHLALFLTWQEWNRLYGTQTVIPQEGKIGPI